MFKSYLLAALVPLTCVVAENTKLSNASHAVKNYKEFTGKVTGVNVRLRTAPDVESSIVREIPKSELFVVVGEKNDFYAVLPPTETKAYIFRSFVLDNVVEGNRVNVRLQPDLEAPVIGHVSSGTRIDGKISSKNSKWLEIAPPKGTVFYVAKEFIDYAGGPDFKVLKDKRLLALSQIMESAQLLTQSEMRKPFDEMDIDRITRSYQSVVEDYVDFPEHVAKAKTLLANLQETYLQRKIAYLEAKASQLTDRKSSNSSEPTKPASRELTATDRMRIWEPLEEALYLTWSTMHHAKSMDDFYIDQKLKSQTLSGILEAYTDPIKNKPGDFILKEKDLPVAYVYSTDVNLEDMVGKRVNLMVSERPNNNFAFPAYFVLDSQ